MNNKKQLFDVIFGLFLIEIEKRSITVSEHPELSKMNETFDLVLQSCLRRISEMNQFIPEFDNPEEKKTNKTIQTRNNPTIIENVSMEFQSIGKELHYQYSLGKIIAIFQIFSYKLRTEGLKMFMKKCRECKINEFYVNEIIMRTLHFNPLSSQYIQSTKNIIELITKRVEYVFINKLFGLCLNGQFTNTITIDIFNPIMMILTEKQKQMIVLVYVILCDSNDYPLFYGIELDQWKKEFILDQELLVNFNVMLNRNLSLTYLLIDLLWLRIYNNCECKQHPVNKRIADILKRFQTTNTICSKTVWRLLLEYTSVDQQLVDEFYKSLSMPSKGK